MHILMMEKMGVSLFNDYKNKKYLFFQFLFLNIILINDYALIGIKAASVSGRFSSGFSMKSRKSSIGSSCNENAECWVGRDNNRVCVDGKCYCKPNYSFDYINNQCVYFTCRLHKECQNYDEHRFCDAYDNCRCENGFVEDEDSMKCTSIKYIGDNCIQDSDCWTDTDSHRVCRNNICECKFFYKYDHHKDKCLIKSVCSNDKECQLYDTNRVCDGYGLCVCKEGFYSHFISDKCIKL